MISNANNGDAIASIGRMKAPLAPPPGGGRLRSPLPPPPNDTRSPQTTRTIPSNMSVSKALQKTSDESSRSIDGAFTDLSKLGVSAKLMSNCMKFNHFYLGKAWLLLFLQMPLSSHYFLN